jgi:hypothetical protein
MGNKSDGDRGFFLLLWYIWILIKCLKPCPNLLSLVPRGDHKSGTNQEVSLRTSAEETFWRGLSWGRLEGYVKRLRWPFPRICSDPETAQEERDWYSKVSKTLGCLLPGNHAGGDTVVETLFQTSKLMRMADDSEQTCQKETCVWKPWVVWLEPGKKIQPFFVTYDLYDSYLQLTTIAMELDSFIQLETNSIFYPSSPNPNSMWFVCWSCFSVGLSLDFLFYPIPFWLKYWGI